MQLSQAVQIICALFGRGMHIRQDWQTDMCELSGWLLFRAAGRACSVPAVPVFCSARVIAQDSNVPSVVSSPSAAEPCRGRLSTCCCWQYRVTSPENAPVDEREGETEVQALPPRFNHTSITRNNAATDVCVVYSQSTLVI